MQKRVEILDMKDRVGTEGVPTGRVISANGYKLMAHTLHDPAIPLLNAHPITQRNKKKCGYEKHCWKEQRPEAASHRQ